MPIPNAQIATSASYKDGCVASHDHRVRGCGSVICCGRVYQGERASDPSRTAYFIAGYRTVIARRYCFDSRCARANVPPTWLDFAVGTDGRAAMA